MKDWMGNLMCPGDSDWCPHLGCTTCQGPFFHRQDPDNGAGRIDESDDDAWERFIHESKQEEARNLEPDSEWRYQNWDYDG